MGKITTFLWMDNEAEEAVNFYKGVFKDHLKIGKTTYYQTETPSNKPVGSVMIVTFELFGQKFAILNGGPAFKFNEAISFEIECEDQKEVDYYSDALSAVPESEICGWVKDKYGISWQINPWVVTEMMNSENKEGAKRVMEALLKMKRLNIAELEKVFNS